MFDADALVKEIAAEAPCGVDLGYDPALQELDTLAQGTPETQFQKGEDPNWRDVQERSLELLKRGKHLRIYVLLTFSSLQTDGFPGLGAALRVLRETLEKHWDQVFPLLDPSDNNDPTERMNLLSTLSPSGSGIGDAVGLKRRILDAPLCAAPGVGRFSLRQYLQATGEMPTPPADAAAPAPPALALIEGAFQAMELPALQAVAKGVADSLAHVVAIEKFLNGKAPMAAPNFEAVRAVLKQAATVTGKQVALRVPAAAEEGGAGAEAGAAPGARPAPRGLSGEIGTTNDVLKALDMICAYYQRVEPSSPVPLLLARARRLAGKDFAEIVKDLTPDAMSRVEMITGVPAAQASGAKK